MAAESLYLSKFIGEIAAPFKPEKKPTCATAFCLLKVLLSILDSSYYNVTAINPSAICTDECSVAITSNLISPVCSSLMSLTN